MFIWYVLSALTIVSMFAVMSWLIVHARTETIYRPLALIAFLTSIPTVIVAFSLTLGTALPIVPYLFDMEPGKYKILGHKSVPKVGVFVLLDNSDYDPPFYYRLPWSRELSEVIENSEDGYLYYNLKKVTRSIGNWEFSWDEGSFDATKEDPPEKVFHDKPFGENGENQGIFLQPSGEP